MSALTEDRDTPLRQGVIYLFDVAADTEIFAGSMVAIDASGHAQPAADTSGLVVVGRAEQHVDNSGGSAGDKTVVVRKGVFGFEPDGSNTPTKANVTGDVYVLDDQTVSTDSGVNSIIAGELTAVDDNYAWVRID